VTTRVIGIGQPAAGDDGVGHAVIDNLAAMTLPAGTELSRVREASALVELLSGADRAVVIDAVVDAGSPGTVHVLDASQLDDAAMSSVSSHGIGVAQALEIARAVADDVAGDVRFVAISIASPSRYQHGLTDDVARAVPHAARAVVDLIEKSASPKQRR